jgi:hypothetical protein
MSDTLMGAGAVPLLEIDLCIVVSLLFLRKPLPGLVSLLGVGPVSLPARIVQRIFAGIFLVGLFTRGVIFLCDHAAPMHPTEVRSLR